MGYICNGESYTLSDSRRLTATIFPTPTTIKQVRSFLGFINYFRDFIPDFSREAQPLYELTKKGQKFNWTETAESAFSRLKTLALQCHDLTFPVAGKPFRIRTDASDLGIGAHLSQSQKSQEENSVAFLSKSFTDTQRRWCTIEKEGYAIFYSIISWRHFLHGERFEVHIDHRILVYIHKSDNPKIVRWKLALQEFDFTIVHIQGKDNVVADYLSRCHDAPTPSRLMLLQDSPPNLRAAFDKVHNGIVGHLALNPTMQALKHLGYDDTNTATVQGFIDGCAVCQKVWQGQGSYVAAVNTTQVQEPFSVIMLDTIGPLTTDKHGHSYITVHIDCFTRFVELIPMAQIYASDTADGCLQVWCRYGAPKEIRSDRGPQFCNELLKQLARLFEIHYQFSLPYRPQANGIVERVNAEIVRHLRALVLPLKHTDDWSTYLPLIQRIVNSKVNRHTGMSPAALLYGKACSLDRNLLFEQVTSEDIMSYAEYNRRLCDTQSQLTNAARNHQNDQIDRALAKAPGGPTKYSVGDFVLLQPPKKKPLTKLGARWLGPFVILDVAKEAHKIQDLATHAIKDVHVSRLKPFREDTTVAPSDIAAWDSHEFLVESILGHRVQAKYRQDKPRRTHHWEFLIHWADYDSSHDSWLPYTNLKNNTIFAQYIRDANLTQFSYQAHPLQTGEEG